MIFYLVQGDVGPQIKATLRRQDTDELIDLTGCDVFFKMRAKGSTAVILTLTAVTTGDYLENGEAIFVFNDGDLDLNKGFYEGEIQVDFSDDSVETVYQTMDIYIREDF